MLSPSNQATQWEKVHLKELEVKIVMCLCATFVHDAVSLADRPIVPEIQGIKGIQPWHASMTEHRSSINHSPDRQFNSNECM